MNRVPSRIRTILLSFVALVSSSLFIAGMTTRKAETGARDSLTLKNINLKIRKKGNSLAAGVGVLAMENEHRGISGGFGMALLSVPSKNTPVPRSYRPIDEVNDELHSLQSKWPDLLSLEKVGVTTALHQPIWAVKVSDNAREREDEPRILFAGVHHAREPIGSKICLEIINQLCEKYGRDDRITHWVDSIEIWFVPIVNPDGYRYVIENKLTFPWWRKNLRDNDGDGVFNPLYDGVDLNRNYEYNWKDGGDGKPGSWFYRGNTPFSELETHAIMNLAVRENFLIGISYHSYGESILFPWGNYKRPPDLELIVDIASGMASKIRKESRHGKYSILPLNGRVGQSSIWMYGELRVIDYIVEVGTEYFPPEESIPFILQENVKGAFYLLDKTLETGVKGHVFDLTTGQPLLAEIEVKEFSSNHVRPRRTEAKYGGFYRLLNPGYFTIEFSSVGYLSKTIRNVKVQNGRFANLEIGLQRKTDTLTNGTTAK